MEQATDSSMNCTSRSTERLTGAQPVSWKFVTKCFVCTLQAAVVTFLCVCWWKSRVIIDHRSDFFSHHWKKKIKTKKAWSVGHASEFLTSIISVVIAFWKFSRDYSRMYEKKMSCYPDFIISEDKISLKYAIFMRTHLNPGISNLCCFELEATRLLAVKVDWHLCEPMAGIYI